MNAFGITGTTLSPGETVANHEDVQLAERKRAYEAATVYCATYEPDHFAALHAAIEFRVLRSTLPVADAIDEVHRDLAAIRARPSTVHDKDAVPALLREMAAYDFSLTELRNVEAVR